MAEPSLRVLPDAATAVHAAATALAEGMRRALQTRGRCVLALSGGSMVPRLCRELAVQDLPWREVHVVQVDERTVPLSHPDRNLGLLRDLPATNLHAMPVEAHDLEAAARDYAELLRELAGTPSVLDVVHLGLGADGHTASLVPGDPVLEVMERDVALSQPYKGRRRMTLTYPVLDRAREIVWLATGAEKHAAIRRLYDEDPALPATRVNAANMYLFTDQAGI